ncbi:N-6 DNA methylase [Shinella sp. S4-D37]|uniref:HsdM family class I SAM-dependent methyltransferase n=1 Tax=Shinella sp. S4-D37 TaxID=3161999 RepID=UPI0034660E80
MKQRAKLTRFAEKRSDDLNKFYTRSAVGQLLCDHLDITQPRSVIDLGAGEGSLSVAVAERWPDASFVAVDIDPSSAPSLKERLNALGVERHEHFLSDVLSTKLESVGGHGEFDLAVCNPPFFRPGWRREFTDFLDAANLGQAVPNQEVNAEEVFLAQNILALRDGGTLAVIVPDGMMTARRSQRLRRALLLQHSVETVIQLPNNAFQDTDAYCFIMILKKGAGPSKEVKLLQYHKKTGLSEAIIVSAAAAESRMDFDYHVTHRSSPNDALTLRMLGADIRRGSLNSVELRAADYSTFHTNGYDRPILNLEGEIPEEIAKKVVVAEPGDILVARIDRNFHKKVAIVEAGRAAITDCVYRVRIPEAFQQAVFTALRSPEGEAVLKASSKGVSARLLGKSDFLDLPLPVEGNELRLLAKELGEKRESFPLLL